MLIDFTVQNYLSIKDEVTLSLLATSPIKKNESELKTISVEKGKFNLLSFIGIYGPNATGKTNLIKGFLDFIGLILFSHKLDLDNKIPSYRPFKLDKNSRTAPSRFEIEFLIDGIRHFFKVEYNEKKILKEELYFYPEGKKAALYVRHQNKPISYGTYYKGEKKSIEKLLLPNTLFLSRAANSNHELLKTVYRYFRDRYDIYVRMDSNPGTMYKTTTAINERGAQYKNAILQILNAGDLNIKDIKIKEDKDVLKKTLSLGTIPKEIKNQFINEMKFQPYIGHSVFSDQVATNEIEYFSLEDEESSGTVKMYDVASKILHALQNGNVLIIDEFNNGLHPHLNKYIVELFINPDINTKGAQLIISTHDTCVLDIEKIRRDQIWFTDKDKFGATELYSLDEFDKNLVRANSKYSKWYLDGRFKAIPTIDFKLISKVGM